MTNPFDDLEADDESPSDDESPTDTTIDVTTTDAVDGAAETDSQPTGTDDDSGPSPSTRESAGAESDRQPGETGPAFEYSEVRQKPLYARDETWNVLEDELGITVVPELRRMGIRDEETREIHDALLKVAIDHADEIAEQVADERRE